MARIFGSKLMALMARTATLVWGEWRCWKKKKIYIIPTSFDSSHPKASPFSFFFSHCFLISALILTSIPFRDSTNNFILVPSMKEFAGYWRNVQLHLIIHRDQNFLCKASWLAYQPVCAYIFSNTYICVCVIVKFLFLFLLCYMYFIW